MKRLLILSAILLITGSASSQITPQSFGLKLKDGQIDLNRMSRLQKDTILINLFTNEDIYMDIAVLYKSSNEIVLFRNLGNGYLDTLKKFPLKKNAIKIESYISPTFPELLTPCFEIKIYYSDNTQEIVRNRQLNSIYDDPVSKAPLRDLTYDSKIFLYDFQFVQNWQSAEQNGHPHQWVARGDIDNDGRIEFIHTFFSMDDTTYQYWPAHLVIFESYSDNKIRVDWDTTFLGHYAANVYDEIVDLDRNGKKEFFAVAYSQLTGDVTSGIFECSGEGSYKFYLATQLRNGYGTPYEMVARDTMKRTESKKPGFWISYWVPHPGQSCSLMGFVFRQKGNLGYNFDYLTESSVHIINKLVYNFEVGEIDGDEQEEFLIGDNQWETNYIHYLDSTGSSTNGGYTLKTIIPGARVAGGYMYPKNYDNDETNEITVCGIALGHGSIGVVKHTGAPGENQFTTMWWDTTGIFAAPNWGIDTATINNEFVTLFPFLDGPGKFTRNNIMTCSRNGIYSYYKSSLTQVDSFFFLPPRFIDLDNDNRINIVAAGGFGYPARYYLFDYEYDGLTNINPNLSNVPDQFFLHQNYPNPFNPVTKIKYDLKSAFPGLLSNVKILVFNALGKEVEILVKEKKNMGSYEVEFNGSKYPSGLYFYSLNINGQIVDVKKMILIK